MKNQNPKLKYIHVGSLRLSPSGKTVVVSVGGKNVGIVWVRDCEALLNRGLDKIPIKSREKVWEKGEGYNKPKNDGKKNEGKESD